MHTHDLILFFDLNIKDKININAYNDKIRNIIKILNQVHVRLKYLISLWALIQIEFVWKKLSIILS